MYLSTMCCMLYMNYALHYNCYTRRYNTIPYYAIPYKANPIGIYECEPEHGCEYECDCDGLQYEEDYHCKYLSQSLY
jgi:hypothetical protein